MKTQFKKEWTPADFDRVEKRLLKYFRGKSFCNHRNGINYFSNNTTFEQLENVLGLPYTSSSSHAMMSMDCNINLFFNPAWHFDRVVIDENNDVLIVLQTSEEKERTFKI